MHNMLIYANQAMTSHQYNIWTKGIVWEQLYGLLCEFCEHFSLNAQVSYCCPSSFLGEGGSKLFKWYTLPPWGHGHGPKGHNFSF